MEKEDQQNTFEKATEAVGWFQLFLSPFLAGVIVSAIIYFSNPNTLTLIFAIIIFALGVVIGIKLASKITKKHGAINFISNTSATPELDKQLKKEKK